MRASPYQLQKDADLVWRATGCGRCESEGEDEPMATTQRATNNRAGTERKKTVKTLIPMRNGMNDEQRKGVVDLLNQQVADHYVLLTKTKFYHWNVEGPEFHDIHELLDEHYETLSEMVDEIAEQTLKLGG